LGTYVRLKNLGILPLWAADHGVGISLYYQDPDQNRVEINASNYSDAWTATEHLRVSRGMMMAHLDPEKMVAAREAGASPWELHELAVRGEFAPEKPYNPGANW
jgi:catechol 2,3-dioxygenase